MECAVVVEEISGLGVAGLPPEVDAVRAGQVRSGLAKYLVGRDVRLVLDATATVFLGVRGFRVIAQVSHFATGLGGGLAVVVPHSGMRHRLQEVWPGEVVLCTSVAAALGEADTFAGLVGFRDEPDDEWRTARLAEPVGGSGAVVPVSGAYCDADTGEPLWLGVRYGSDDPDAERLVPVHHLLFGDDGRLSVTLPTGAVRHSPALHGAPEEFCDCVEHPLVRYYADAVNPVPAEAWWPVPTTCSARCCRRAPDLTTALAEYLGTGDGAGRPA